MSTETASSTEAPLMAGAAATGDAPATTAAATNGDAPANTGDKPSTDATAKPAEGQAKPGDKPAAKAPEKYEFKPAEGFELNEALASEFTPVLRELDLTQEQADKLVAFAPRLIEQSVDAAVSKTLESIGFADAKDWAANSKTDKEFGGDKFAENLAVVKAARDQFATPELRKLLETTPLGNHPEVLRLFYRIGKQITADGYVPNGKTTSNPNDARRLYSASKMNP